MLLELLQEREIELEDYEMEEYDKIVKKFNELGLEIGIFEKRDLVDSYFRGIHIFPENKEGKNLTFKGEFSNFDFMPTLAISELQNRRYVNQFLDDIEIAFERNKVFEKLKALGYVNKKIKSIVVETNVKEIEIELNERNLFRIIEKHADLKDLMNIENRETEVFEAIIPTLDFKEIYFIDMFKVIREKNDIVANLKEKIK